MGATIPTTSRLAEVTLLASNTLHFNSKKCGTFDESFRGTFEVTGDSRVNEGGLGDRGAIKSFAAFMRT